VVECLAEPVNINLAMQWNAMNLHLQRSTVTEFEKLQISLVQSCRP
jgi:hypothetical protein